MRRVISLLAALTLFAALSSAGLGAAAQSPTSFIGSEWSALPTSQPIVALTFDAGANADGLPSILSTLSREGVPATFFLTGKWTQTYPDAARQIAAVSGNSIGNHTYDHPDLTTLSDQAVRQEVLQAQSAIISGTNRDPRPLFRFPYGARDARTMAIVGSLGYGSVRWTVDTLGWEGTSGGQSPDSVVGRALGAITPGEIILMHVGSNPNDGSTLDADALPRIISGLRARKYGFVALWDFLYGARIAGAPTVASWASGRLDVFARGLDGSLMHKWFDGTAWHDWESLGGRIVGDPAPVASGTGNLDVFVRGADNQLWRESYRMASNHWQWSGLAGVLRAAPAAASSAPAQADAFVEGTDLALWRWNSSTNRWSGLGGRLADQPAAVSWGNGRVDAFVTGLDAGLWHWSTENGWESGGPSGLIFGRPAAVTWGSRRLDVFGQGTDGALWHGWSSGSGWQWERFGGAMADPPVAATFGVGRLDAFVRGYDNGLWHLQETGSSWMWEALNGPVASTPAAVSWGPGQLDVFARGFEGELWHTAFNGSWLPWGSLG